MAPPVLVVPPVKAEVGDITGQWNVANRRLEARLVDHDPRHALLFHERANRRGFFGLGPLAMAQLDSQWKARAAHAANQILEVLERARVRPKAGRKLSQQRPQLACFGERA